MKLKSKKDACMYRTNLVVPPAAEAGLVALSVEQIEAAKHNVDENEK